MTTAGTFGFRPLSLRRTAATRISSASPGNPSSCRAEGERTVAPLLPNLQGLASRPSGSRAEGERFELSVGGYPTAVFKTAALGHYASPPRSETTHQEVQRGSERGSILVLPLPAPKTHSAARTRCPIARPLTMRGRVVRPQLIRLGGGAPGPDQTGVQARPAQRRSTQA